MRFHPLLKFGLAIGIILFAIWYDQLWYNIAVSIVLLSFLRWQKIDLFRFPKQAYLFFFLMLSVFLFRVVGGFGEVLLTLPWGFRVTWESLVDSITFVSQLMLIFIAFGAAINSSNLKTFFYYANRLENLSLFRKIGADSICRVGAFSVFILPRFLPRQKTVTSRIKKEISGNSQGWKDTILHTGNGIFAFLEEVVRQSEAEYVLFKNAAGNYDTAKVSWHWNDLLLVLVLVSVHLVWVLRVGA